MNQSLTFILHPSAFIFSGTRLPDGRLHFQLRERLGCALFDARARAFKPYDNSGKLDFPNRGRDDEP
jgi:hypothetical protein